MKVRGYRVVVKPALVVLAAAVVIAAIAIPFAHRAPAEAVPEYGYVVPDHWKFESHDGAEVAFQSGESIAGPASPSGVHLLDSESGFTVHVTKIGPKADCVYLRNSLNLDTIKRQNDANLELTFNAEAPQEFPVTFTIRDPLESAHGGEALWSKSFPIQGPSREYSATIPLAALRKSAHSACIIAAHLGAQTGTVKLAKIHLR